MKIGRTTLGPGSVYKASAGKTGLETPAQQHSSFNERVGGQVILVAPRWGQRVVDTWTDPSGLGVAMSVTIDLGHARALCTSTYFPVKPADNQRGDRTLWRRLRTWMRTHRQHGSGRSDPLKWIQHLLEAKTVNFLRLDPANITILAGDLNASIGSRGGSHPTADRGLRARDYEAPTTRSTLHRPNARSGGEVITPPTSLTTSCTHPTEEPPQPGLGFTTSHAGQTSLTTGLWSPLSSSPEPAPQHHPRVCQKSQPTPLTSTTINRRWWPHSSALLKDAYPPPHP